jgi:hypothetical protein
MGKLMGKTTRSRLQSRPLGTLAAAGLALALLGAACGGGSKGSGGGGGMCTVGTFDDTPVGQCKKFVNTFCCRAITCDPPDGGTVTDCTSLYEVAIGCDRATSTAFPTCISDTSSLSCSGLGLNPGGSGFRPPASCDDPLNIPLSDAQHKCGVLGEVLCDPVDVCANNPPTDQAFVDCVNQAYFDIQCEFATGVSGTYNMCLDDLCAQAGNAADGGTVPDGGLALPPTCQNVIVGPM